MTWHLEKSGNHNRDGVWLVFVEGRLVGTIAPARTRWTRRPCYQAFAGNRRVGHPRRTREEAVEDLLEPDENPPGRPET